MADNINVLTTKDLAKHCKNKSNEIKKEAETNSHLAILFELSRSMRVYFDILGAKQMASGQSVFQKTHGGFGRLSTTKTEKTLNFLFDLGAWNLQNPQASYSDFHSRNTYQATGTFFFTGAASSAKFKNNKLKVDKTNVVIILKRVREIIRNGIAFAQQNSGGTHKELTDLTTGTTFSVVKTGEDDIFKFIGEKVNKMRASLATTLRNAGVSSANLEEEIDKAIFSIFKQLARIDSETAFSNFINPFGESIVSNVNMHSEIKSGDLRKALRYNNAANELSIFIKNKLYNSDLALNNTFTSKKKYKKRFLELLKAECEAAPDTKGFNTFKGVNRVKRRLTNLRCILPFLDHLYAKGSAAALDGIVPYDRKTIYNLQSSGKKKGNSFFYKADNFPLLFMNSSESFFFINDLFNANTATEKPELESLTKVTNLDISQLVPKIQMTKVRYDENENEQEIPLAFSNKTELDIPGILGTPNRENAGIKRCTLRMIGRTPAEYDKFIECRVTLFFDSINAFLKNRIGLIKNDPKGRSAEYSYKDLLMRHTKYREGEREGLLKSLNQAFQKPFKQSKTLENTILKFDKAVQEVNFRVVNEKYFRMRLDVGWAPNEKHLNQELINFIKQTNLSLYLTLQTHDFNFATDGTLTLDLTYMGAIEGQITAPLDANIFYTKELQRAQKAATSVASIIQIIEKMSDAEKKQHPFSKSLKEFAKLKSNLVGFIEGRRSQTQRQLWNVLSNEDKKMLNTNCAKTPTHILLGEIPPNIVGIGKGASAMLTAEQKKFMKGKYKPSDIVIQAPFVLNTLYQNAKAGGSGTYAKAVPQLKMVEKTPQGAYNAKTTGKGFLGRDTSSQKDPNLARGGLQPPAFYGPSDGSQGSTLSAQKSGVYGKVNSKDAVFRNLSSAQAKKTKEIQFYCFRFGSLIQAAIQNIWNNNPSVFKDVVVSLGPLVFDGIDGKKKYSNFSYIPILMDDWKMHMTREVVDTVQGLNYPFMAYFFDMVNKLLIPSMGAGNSLSCGDSAGLMSPLAGVEPRVAIFTAKRHDKLKPPKAKQTCNVDARYLNINLDMIAGTRPILNKNIGTARSTHERANVKTFIVLYDAGLGIAGAPGVKGTKFEQHMKKNIMHFYIGADKGILRGINFSKSDLPFFREAQTLDKGDASGGLLREKYNASVECVGNTYFLPGMKFYLDPTLTGMSTDHKNIMQRDLGLGGYYVITHVAADISPTDFQTTIDGSWVSFDPGDPTKS